MEPPHQASPPPVPFDAAGAPAKTGLPTWVKVLLVCGALFLCLPVVAGAIGTVAIIVPQMQEKQKRFVCASNLSQLGGLFIVERMDAPKGSVPRSGPGLFLEWRTATHRIQPSASSVLVCPGDAGALRPTDPGAITAYDNVDLDHAPRALCSYAVRDFEQFPLEHGTATVQVIAACVHHKGGANVLFDNGSARFVTNEEFGVPTGTELTVGPDSPAQVLRVVRYGDGSVK